MHAICVAARTLVARAPPASDTIAKQDRRLTEYLIPNISFDYAYRRDAGVALRIDGWAARRRRSAIEAATAELDLDEADVEELHSFLERAESSSSMRSIPRWLWRTWTVSRTSVVGASPRSRLT